MEYNREIFHFYYESLKVKLNYRHAREIIDNICCHIKRMVIFRYVTQAREIVISMREKCGENSIKFFTFSST